MPRAVHDKGTKCYVIDGKMKRKNVVAIDLRKDFKGSCRKRDIFSRLGMCRKMLVILPFVFW